MTGIQNHKATQLPESLSNYQVTQWSESFSQWRTQFLAFGFKEDDLFTIYRVIAAIILLCDLEFTKIEANTTTNSKSAAGSTPVEVVYVHNYKVLRHAAELLCVNEDDLMNALLTTSMPQQTSAAKGASGAPLPKSWDDAVATRDNLARALYHRLFGWIVRSINSSMNSDEFK